MRVRRDGREEVRSGVEGVDGWDEVERTLAEGEEEGIQPQGGRGQVEDLYEDSGWEATGDDVSLTLRRREELGGSGDGLKRASSTHPRDVEMSRVLG